MPEDVQDTFGFALLPKEVIAGHRHAQARYERDTREIEGGGSARQGRNLMIEIEEGSTNVYADLGIPNADEMQVKAQLASQIGEVIKVRKWKQDQAAEVLGMSQSKVSKMLRGQFRDISETKMLECLTRLGLDVQIVIGADSYPTTPGRVSVVA